MASESFCETHGAFERKEYSIGDRRIATGCPECMNTTRLQTAQRKERMETEQKRKALAALVERACIPKRFCNRSFENFRAETDAQRLVLRIAKRYADEFDERMEQGGGLLFCGGVGTGKTHLAAAIANAVLQHGRVVLFTSVIELISRVKDTYRQGADESERKIIKAHIAPDLLILDEVGIQYGTDAEKIILFRVMQGRYEDVKPTILLTNLTPDEATDYLGYRVVDRLQEGGGGIVRFEWESYRKRVASDERLQSAAA